MCVRLEIPSTRICRGFRAVESSLFLPAKMHYPAVQCFLLSLCFKPLFMGFVVSGSALRAGVLPPNEELTFKYHKASLVCLPLRCETECKLLKIGIGNVELEDKSSLRLSDMLREPVLLRLGQLFLCTGSDPVQWFCLESGIPPLWWDLSHSVGSSITGNFFPLLCKEKNGSLSLVDGSVAHLGTSQK